MSAPSRPRHPLLSLSLSLSLTRERAPTLRSGDRYAANSQFITHLVGRVLNELGPKLEQTPINTKGFESMLGLVETTCSDSFELFYGARAAFPPWSVRERDRAGPLSRAGLYRYSQYSKVTLLELRKALADLELRLIAMDVEQERLAREVTSQDGAARGNGSATAAAPQPFVDVP